MVTLIIAVYFVIALTCIGLGLYLSYPGHTWGTLPHDALNLLPRRSRPALTVKDEPFSSVHYVSPVQPAPVEVTHADTQYHLSVPEVAPTADEGHESHEEPEPAEQVHDEP